LLIFLKKKLLIPIHLHFSFPINKRWKQVREKEKERQASPRERESVPAVDGGEREGNREKERAVVGLEVVSARDGSCDDREFTGDGSNKSNPPIQHDLYLPLLPLLPSLLH
jgi:hypothetical protein